MLKGMNCPNCGRNAQRSGNFKIKCIYCGMEAVLNPYEAADIADKATGNRGRVGVWATSIPSNAKYVSVEFSFPDGVGRYTNNAGELVNDYFKMELNTLLFNSHYGGFVDG